MSAASDTAAEARVLQEDQASDLEPLAARVPGAHLEANVT